MDTPRPNWTPQHIDLSTDAHQRLMHHIYNWQPMSEAELMAYLTSGEHLSPTEAIEVAQQLLRGGAVRADESDHFYLSDSAI